MKALGANYLTAARERAPGAARFIDKLPLNSLYLGLIHLALPNARVVHVERHPVDTCLAMYKYLFKNAYPFSYDLDELATYYIEYHRLMAHWRSVLPEGWMHDIRYEDLVRDQRGVTAELLDYLGLAWEDACLDFHLNVQPSTTGSASQSGSSSTIRRRTLAGVREAPWAADRQAGRGRHTGELSRHGCAFQRLSRANPDGGPEGEPCGGGTIVRSRQVLPASVGLGKDWDHGFFEKARSEKWRAIGIGMWISPGWRSTSPTNRAPTTAWPSRTSISCPSLLRGVLAVGQRRGHAVRRRREQAVGDLYGG